MRRQRGRRNLVERDPIGVRRPDGHGMRGGKLRERLPRHRDRRVHEEGAHRATDDFGVPQVNGSRQSHRGGHAQRGRGPDDRAHVARVLEAIQNRTSDIHIEPLEKRFRVRYRVDGVLIEVENPPKRLQLSIISRLKIMSNISIAEKRVPQDGRIQIAVGGKQLDLRVSSLPTVHGEMAQWREKLFAQMHLNASAAADFLKLPSNSVVELGSKIEI